MEIALDRKEDETVVESKKHIAGDPETSAFVKVREDAAEKLEGSSHDTVEITAQDGIKLVGHWRFCKNPKRIMIAMHGWRSSWARDFGLIADSFIIMTAMSCMRNREARITAGVNIWDLA